MSDPGLFDRLGRLYIKTKVDHLRSHREKKHDDVKIDIIPKGDDDINLKCDREALRCKVLARKYYKVAIILRIFIGVFMLAGGLSAMYSWEASLALCVFCSLLETFDYALSWNSLSDKYADLAIRFRQLIISKDPEKEHRYNEYLIMLEAAILERDSD